MQAINRRARGPKADTQPVLILPPKPRLLMLYGGGTPNDTVDYLNRLAATTTLAPRIVNIEQQRLSARDAVTQLVRDSDSSAHLMLCVHGAIAPASQGRIRAGRHLLNVAQGSAEPVHTKQFLAWMTAELATAGKENAAPPATLPFVHLFSCQAGVLRKQIKPGSALWRGAYYLIYASKRSTSLSACGNAMTTAVRYVDWCQRQRCAVDPLTLLYLAGLRRGECMTLMGGDLSEPLVWHAPAAEADLTDQRSMAALRGHARDIDRLQARAAALTNDERALLPQASLRELLSSRLERDDATAVAALLTAHPALRDECCIQGVPPLVEAADKCAHRCLAVLLAQGADPNAAAGHSSALQTCVIGPRPNLPGLTLLLAQGADPNLADEDGYTPLALAVAAEWTPGIDCLLAHGARMDRQADGLTCLEAAALNGKSHAVDLLLRAGAGEADGLTQALVEEVLTEGHADIAAALRAALMARQASAAI